MAVNQLGQKSKFYYNSGTFGSPTWVLLSGVSNLKIGAKWNAAEGSTRASPVNTKEPTMLDLPISGKLLVDHGADYLILAGDAFARTLVDVMALDDLNSANGAEGVRYEGKIHQWEEDQSLPNILFRDFEIWPCLSANAKQTVLVTSGSPVFSTIA